MILDRLTNADVYRKLGDHFAAGFDYLRKNLAGVPDGRYEIRGDEVFAMIQSYDTKPPEQGKWEAHRKYADIQFMITGQERMGFAPIEKLRSQVAYDGEKDLEFFAGGASEGQLVTVDEGSFTVFLPHDVHMPNLALAAPQRVKKVVVKVKLD